MSPPPPAKSPPCPVCQKETPPRGPGSPRPFCSERCRQVDLSAWFTGRYALPAEEEVDPDELEAALERQARADHDEN